MIERDPDTGFVKVDWDSNPKGEDMTWLRGVLNDARGKRFLDYLNGWAINESFTAIAAPNAERAAGVALGVKKVSDAISACGLPPTERPPLSAEEVSRDLTLATAELAHLGH